MKMMRSTNMTSTMGVTFISDMTGRRRCRRLPATAAVPPFIAMPIYPRSSICRDRIAENSSANPSRRWACLFTSEMNLL